MDRRPSSPSADRQLPRVGEDPLPRHPGHVDHAVVRAMVPELGDELPEGLVGVALGRPAPEAPGRHPAELEGLA